MIEASSSFASAETHFTKAKPAKAHRKASAVASAVSASTPTAVTYPKGYTPGSSSRGKPGPLDKVLVVRDLADNTLGIIWWASEFLTYQQAYDEAIASGVIVAGGGITVMPTGRIRIGSNPILRLAVNRPDIDAGRCRIQFDRTRKPALCGFSCCVRGVLRKTP